MFFLGCIYGISSVTGSLSSNKSPLRLTVYPIKHTQGNANKKLALYIIHEENHQIYSSIIHKIGSKNICNTENLKKKSYKITISYAIPQEMLWKEKM